MSAGHPHADAGGLTCRPLDSYEEILALVTDPPPWRALARPLQPHSPLKVRNCDVHGSEDVRLESPQSFCHVVDEDATLPHRHPADTLPRTLVCHDMANGYHDDCFVDGTPVWDAYTFHNWAAVDIFCYFSHHLVTVPPLGWINAAHLHGCKVIGTLITEWADGVEFWNQVLESEDTITELASALTAIAKALRFEGWLLNVENKISQPERLLLFVRTLHAALHAEVPHAELIWYDSVTVKGDLNWQNKLNDNNRAFFDACDGLFTNYSWSPADVAESAAAAGARRHSVYVGVDVWGRNFYGGGMFNTQAAVKVVFAADCSLAVFAPAWTHEALQADPQVALGAHAQWLLRDRALWGSLWPYLNTRLPHHLPFSTGFCRGQGRQRRHQGEVLSPGPWYNVRHQQYQPNAAHGPHGYRLAAAARDRGGLVRLRSRDGHLPDGTPPTSESADATPPPDDAPGKHDELLVTDVKPSSNQSPATHHHQRFASGSATRVLSRVRTALRAALRPLAACTDRADPAVMAAPSSEPSMQQLPVRLRLGAERTLISLALVPEERECLELCLSDAFTGGGCLRVHPSDASSARPRLIRLLLCSFPATPALALLVVTKQQWPQQYLTVVLQTDAGRVTLVGRDAPPGPPPPLTQYPLVTSSPAFNSLRAHLLLHQPAFYVSTDNDYGWDVRYYTVRVVGAVRGVYVRTGLVSGPLLLGHFGLTHIPPEVLS